jgi:hypothetical protein
MHRADGVSIGHKTWVETAYTVITSNIYDIIATVFHNSSAIIHAILGAKNITIQISTFIEKGNVTTYAPP